jgi:hypothetical protein
MYRQQRRRRRWTDHYAGQLAAKPVSASVRFVEAGIAHDLIELGQFVLIAQADTYIPMPLAAFGSSGAAHRTPSGAQGWARLAAADWGKPAVPRGGVWHRSGRSRICDPASLQSGRAEEAIDGKLVGLCCNRASIPVAAPVPAVGLGHYRRRDRLFGGVGLVV